MLPPRRVAAASPDLVPDWPSAREVRQRIAALEHAVDIAEADYAAALEPGRDAASLALDAAHVELARLEGAVDEVRRLLGPVVGSTPGT